MSVVFYILFAFLLLYAIILAWLARGFVNTPVFKAWGTLPDISITIIICARNEERHVPLCLNTLLRQQYNPANLQILFINDASTDNTAQLADAILKKTQVAYTIINNVQHKGKKQSIAYAMQFAHHQVIITRDADTFTRNDNWLKSISEWYQTHPSDMIIAPVALTDNFGLLWALQAIENNLLTLISAGSATYKKPFLCSGANLIFTQNAFQKAGAYASHMHIASGDDVLFLEELKKIEGTTITWLKSKEALVYTFPCYTFRSLIKQKTRWASKFKVNNNPLNAGLAVLTFIVNLGWLFCLVYGYAKPHNNSASLVFVVSKLIIDILLLFLTSGFIKNRYLLWFGLPVGCIYPLYACLVALRAVFVKPDWK